MKMHNNIRRYLVLTAMALFASVLIYGCGSSSRESAGEGATAAPTKVGSESCTNTCHANTQDVTGDLIAAAWSGTTHTTDAGVQCEDCHGPASLHWGVGPIPVPTPLAPQCNVCHGLTSFYDTGHANGNLVPDKTFSQIPTPVSTGKHIEECSVCHNSVVRFDFDIAGNLLKPDPDNLPDPVVSCPSCHDAHQPQQKVTIAQRSSPVGHPLFRKYLVNPTGEQSATGMPLAAIIYQPNGAVQPDGTLDPSKVVGKNNELNPDRLCAACHTKGKYKNSGGDTHQPDTYTQWTQSGHGDRNAAPFALFSANPGAYTDEATGNPFTDFSHRTSYPVDMALSTFASNGPANTSQNAGNNNFACFKCHNGLTSLAWQDNVQGTPQAPVVFGDSTVTCITCHDPHANVPGQSKNTRKPVLMTVYDTSPTSAVQLHFSGNVFLDDTPVPDATGNATICVYCHQGRESGFTLFKLRIFSDATLPGAFLNNHYLGAGAMLWGRNGYEYPGKQYGVNTAHQQTNCYGCHMAEGGPPDLGRHTWKIVSDDDSAVNSATCNAASCHNGRVPTTNSDGQFDNFRDTLFDPANDYDGNGVAEGIAVEIAGLENQLIGLLKTNGIEYDDLAYPYFFKPGLPHTSANAFTNWTLPALKAAFNLSFVIRGLPIEATSNIGQPNPSAAVHNYRYNIELLRDSYDDLQAKGVPGQTDRSTQPRPAGSRPATNYDVQPGGVYNPRQ
jgi:hypothetical protein